MCNFFNFIAEVFVSKQTLVNAVALATNMSKANASKAVDAISDSIKSSLKTGEEFRWPGVGTFKKLHVKAKTVKSPRDRNVDIKVPARNRVKFSAGKELKEAANS